MKFKIIFIFCFVLSFPLKYLNVTFFKEQGKHNTSIDLYITFFLLIKIYFFIFIVAELRTIGYITIFTCFIIRYFLHFINMESTFWNYLLWLNIVVVISNLYLCAFPNKITLWEIQGCVIKVGHMYNWYVVSNTMSRKNVVITYW